MGGPSGEKRFLFEHFPAMWAFNPDDCDIMRTPLNASSRSVLFASKQGFILRLSLHLAGFRIIRKEVLDYANSTAF